jgi:hypothetical protein
MERTGRVGRAGTLGIAGGLLAGLFALTVAQAGAASVTPTHYDGNKTCADFGMTTIAKFDPPQSGTQAGITLTRVDGSHIDWSSTVAVDAVLVKGGDAGNLYSYEFDTFGDTGLVTPDNSSGGPAGLSHVEFCTDGKNEPKPPVTPTPTPPPGGETPGGGTPGGGTDNPGGGGVLPGGSRSGAARLRGPSGCVKTAFRARVSGREIASVRFLVDGKLVKKVTTSKPSYVVKINPRRLGFGRHKVVAKVTFKAEAQTSPRTLRLTFRRCARQAIAPRFTG